MKNILVPTDFSACAANALNYAAKLATFTQANIYFLHVYQPVLPATDIPVVEIIPDEVLEREAAEKMHLMIKKLKENNGWDIPVTVMSIAGILADEINQVVKEKKIDVVIMGMRGKSTAIDKIFGSNATDMIKKVISPLLLIPQDEDFHIPERIAIAFDFNHPDDIKKISITKEFVKRFNSRLLAFTIIKEKDDDVSRKAVVFDAIDKLLHDYEHSIHFNVHDNVPEGILSFIEEHKAKLLVLFHHSHNIFARIFTAVISKEISFDVKVPLLVVNEKANIYPPVDL